MNELSEKEWLEPKCVRIWRGDTGDPSNYRGTGFLITRRHIVTAAHVVKGIDPDKLLVTGRAWGSTRTVREGPHFPETGDPRDESLDRMTERLRSQLFAKSSNPEHIRDALNEHSKPQIICSMLTNPSGIISSARQQLINQWIAFWEMVAGKTDSAGPGLNNRVVVIISVVDDPQETRGARSRHGIFSIKLTKSGVFGTPGSPASSSVLSGSPKQWNFSGDSGSPAAACRNVPVPPSY